MEAFMKKHLPALLCTLLVLFFSFSCSPNTGPDFTGDTQQVADQLKPADLIKDIFETGTDGVKIEYSLLPYSSLNNQYSSINGQYILQAIVSFTSYLTDAGRIIDGNLIYRIPGVVSGGKFSATGSCSVSTEKALIIETAEGNVPVTISIEQATIEASATITADGKAGSVSVTITTTTTITTTVNGDEVETPEEEIPPSSNPGGGGSGGGTTVEKEHLPLTLSSVPAYTEFTIGSNTYCFHTLDIVVEDGKITDGTLVNDYCSHIAGSSPVVGFAGMDSAYGFFLPLKIEADVDDGDNISVVFIEKEIPADILMSGDSFYAVILLTDIGNLKFNNEILAIKITTDTVEYDTELELIQRPNSRSPGLLLYPTPVN